MKHVKTCQNTTSSAFMIDAQRLQAHITRAWDSSVVPTLIEYIKIPNKSPLFDPDWERRGHMDAAVDLFENWARSHIKNIPGATVEVLRLDGRTPLMFIDIPGASDELTLLYGHLDKQPEMEGWNEGLGPWTPALRGDKLYGRGGADDGYALFAALTAISALREQARPHPRCVILIEACEESGSYDLPHYVDVFADRLGDPSLVICLDSGCGDYDRVWLTTSLRGAVNGILSVTMLEEGVHSGDASGIVPSSFRILRGLLSRLEDERTGFVKPEAFHVNVPSAREREAACAADVLGANIYTRFPFVAGAQPADTDFTKLILDRTWRAQLTVTGMSELPSVENAGGVLGPSAAAMLSLRLPPSLNSRKAAGALEELVTTAPPYGALVRFKLVAAGEGWDSPPLALWLKAALNEASMTEYGASAQMMGEGGTIPFMAMLGERFPSAQFVVTGVLGPRSNAHGPNEFLHLPTARRVTGVVARILAAQAATHD